MEINPLLITVAGVIVLVLGLAAGWLLGSVGDEGEPEPNDSVDQAPPGGRKGRYTPVTRLWRERGAGKLIVEMDGKAYVEVDGLTQVQRERLESTARDLRVWLGMGLSAADAPAMQSAPAPQGAPVQQVGPVVPLPPVNRTPAPPVSAPAPATQAMPSPVPTPPPARVSSKPPVVPPVKGAKGKEEPVVAQPIKSIVMQIEDILQDMIATTPLNQRGIHLSEDPRRGVIVQVGLNFYEGIDAVTDPEVKAAIRAAVQTWENSQ